MDNWDLLDIYFRDNKYPFNKHHLDSYRQFLKNIIPKTIRSYNPITMVKFDEATGEESLRLEIYVGGKDESSGIYLDRPIMFDQDNQSILMLPNEARLRDLTYATKLYADIEVVFTQNGNVQTKHFNHTLIGVIPIMLHSDQCVLNSQGAKVLRNFNECPMDPGGYFIVNGKEKVIVSQERITTNRLFITESPDPYWDIKAYIRCTSAISLSPRTVEFYVITQNRDNAKEEHRGNLGAILVSLPSINGLIPLTWVFRAFGIESDRAIVECICGNTDITAFNNFIYPSLVHGSQCMTTKDVYDKLKNRVMYESIQYLKYILIQEVFPNIENFDNKGKYLGYLVNSIMKVALKINPFSDRDSYIFKRVDISGMLLGQLFQETYSKFRKHVRNSIDQEYYYGPWKNTGQIDLLVRKDNLHKILPPKIISEIFERSLKGMWGPKTDDPDQGLVQDISRISYIGFLSHLRRVNMPLDRSIKVTEPHRLHSQQWGIMCPFESPDGASIGYLKNFALMTCVTFGTDPKFIIPLLDELNVIPLNDIPNKVSGDIHSIRVFINGNYYGITSEPIKCVERIRLYRRNGLVNQFVSVSWNIKDNEIRIQTEAGRPCRPLCIVDESGKVLFESVSKSTSWFNLVFGTLRKNVNSDTYYQEEYISPYSLPECKGIDEESLSHLLKKHSACIEYLDIEEENCMLIAMKKEDLTDFHTHLEIHPTTAFSVVTQIVPFANHNQAPRVYFHAAQSKQAQGVYATTFSKRFDTAAYIQHYPQKRIIDTRGSHYVGNNVMPNGANVIAAIMTYSGFNQEDGIMINKASIERGLFNITVFKSITAKEKILSPTEQTVFVNPIDLRNKGSNITGVRHANYTLLDPETGIITKESYVPKGQDVAVIGMAHVKNVYKIENRGVLSQQVVEKQYTDASLFTDVNHYGTVDSVYVSPQIQGHPSKVAKVRFRKVRKPEFGDKCCSAHGQKGVIGMIIPESDMPFTKDGIKPDIIINPHALPTRMTIGHLVETVFSKLCCLEGMHGDGTCFIPFDSEKVYTELEGHKFEKHGNEILYNGRTGQQISTEIFIGPIYYYRLKHMVADKIQARGNGPKVMLTQQPTSGRSKKGGLRIGEMERDVLLAYGMSMFSKESMMERSDKYQYLVCRDCGLICVAKKHSVNCLNCKKQNTALVSTPYTFKLLIQELEAMGLQMRLYTEDQEIDSESESDSDTEEPIKLIGGADDEEEAEDEEEGYEGEAAEEGDEGEEEKLEEPEGDQGDGVEAYELGDTEEEREEEGDEEPEDTEGAEGSEEEGDEEKQEKTKDQEGELEELDAVEEAEEVKRDSQAGGDNIKVININNSYMKVQEGGNDNEVGEVNDSGNDYSENDVSGRNDNEVGDNGVTE